MVAALSRMRHGPARRSAARRKIAARSSHAMRDHAACAVSDTSIARSTSTAPAWCQVARVCVWRCGMTTRATLPVPTRAQVEGWPAIARGDSTLILAPTGSGKTLAAFLWCINRLMFEALPRPDERCRVLYVSPLKALAVDVERNLRAPIAGIAAMAGFRGTHYEMPAVAVRTGDTPPRERARFRREPSDILITTPESLYLLLTSSSRETLRSIDTVIVDEIHALVPTKRGAHLALSLERL